MNSKNIIDNQRQNNLIYNDFNNKILEDDYQERLKYNYELGEDYFIHTRTQYSDKLTSKQKGQ